MRVMFTMNRLFKTGAGQAGFKCFPCAFTGASSGENLNLTVPGGSHYNWLLRDNTTAAAILLNRPDYNRTALGPGFR